MTNAIKTIQEHMGMDLAQIELLPYLDDDQLKMIEQTYQSVYDILTQVNRMDNIKANNTK
jgi:ribosomal protein S24E